MRTERLVRAADTAATNPIPARTLAERSEGAGMEAGRKRELEEKVYAGERLTRDDGLALFGSEDLIWLGRLAHHVRTTRHGDRVSFVVSRRVDLAGDPVRQAAELSAGEVTELHLVADPGLPWRRHPDLLRAIKAATPGVQLAAFTASDLHLFSVASGGSLEAVLDELTAAGLDALAGDLGVARPSDGGDAGWEQWSAVHRLASAKGISMAAALRFGDVEEPPVRVDRLLRLRELQDETGALTRVALVGQGASDRDPVRARAADLGPASVADVLRTAAVCRLLLDNVPHLSAGWPTVGLSVTLLSFQFGVDDLDAAGADSRSPGDPPDPLTREDLVNLIQDAGFRPVERDSRHRVIHEYAAPPSLAERRSVPQQVWS